MSFTISQQQFHFGLAIDINGIHVFNIEAIQAKNAIGTFFFKAYLPYKISGLIVIKIDGSSRYFSVLVSAGFDSLTVSMVTDDIKSKFGKFAYIQKLLKIIKKRRFIDLKTKVNNKKYKNILTCVSNGKYYGGKIHLTDSELDDNNFDTIIIKKFDPISMINYMITRNNNKNIIKLKTKNVEINSEHTNYPVQIDGDYYNNLPIKIETTDKFINVICL